MFAGGSVHAQASERRSVFFVLLVLASILTTLISPAQTYPYREYTIDDGLPQSESMAIFQDSRDYLWVSTRNGLARFDGQTFIPYLRKDGLPSNIVTLVFEDRDGTIWAVTSNGLGRFNGRDFKSYPVPSYLRIKNMGMGCDYGDTATFLLTGSVDAAGDKILLFRNGKYYDFTSMHPVLTGKSLQPDAFDTRDSALYLLNSLFEVYKFHNDSLALINEGPVTKVKLTEAGPLFINDFATDGISHAALLNEIDGSTPAFPDKEGTRWLRTQSRIFRLLSDAFIEYDKDNGLPDNTWALAADPSGGLWAGTVDYKLRYFDGTSFTER
ncbi:hypothetical protein EG827_14165, partial [bacterium]|nr:hypothetical protein [bacterium]